MKSDEEGWNRLVHKLIRLVDLLIARLESSDASSLTLSIQGEPMADFPLNAGDSTVVTVTDTDDVTGAVVVPDAGSLTLVSSNPGDTIVDHANGTFTLTAGTTKVGSLGNTVTANATVGGAASKAGVGTYDVIAVTPPPPDTTTLSVAFGTETENAGDATTAEVESPAEDATEVAGTFRNS